MLDLLIKGGMVIDGSASPGFYAAVGISGDTVSIHRGDVSHLEKNAKKVLDAKGRVATPGFIDVHAHSALMVLSDPKHHAKVHQGITTELYGIDGNSYAPFRKKQDLDWFITMNSGLEGAPDIKADWLTVTEYLNAYDRKIAVNMAYVVGNSPIRINAMGWDDRKPTKKELDNQKAILREAMKEGAVGISTGLDYPPGSYADTDELVELSKEGARLGGFYHTHVRYWLGDRYLDPFKEALEIGHRSGIPIHLTHLLPASHYPGGSRALLQMVYEERDKGLDVTFDNFPYPYAGTRLTQFLPHWSQSGGPPKILERLRSPEARKRIHAEMATLWAPWEGTFMTYFDKPHNKRFEGKSVAEAAEMMKKPPAEAVCDLLLDENLRISWHALSVDPMMMGEFVTDPLQMVGSDALLIGDYPPELAYGTFPYILGKYVRNEKLMSLPEAIRKMTSYPAQRLGIPDRGLLRDGMKADIVVFDAQTIQAHTTRADRHRHSTGIDYVIVNGAIVVDHGKHTNALPGRALRRGRAKD